jgi:hypothetical protein
MLNINIKIMNFLETGVNMKIKDMIKFKGLKKKYSKLEKETTKIVENIGEIDISENDVKAAGKTTLRRVGKTTAVVGAWCGGVALTAIVAAPGLVPAIGGTLVAAVTYKVLNRKKNDKKDK